MTHLAVQLGKKSFTSFLFMKERINTGENEPWNAKGTGNYGEPIWPIDK